MKTHQQCYLSRSAEQTPALLQNRITAIPMAVTPGRKWIQFLGVSFTSGWAEVTPGQTLIDVFFSCFHLAALPSEGRGPHLQLHFAKCLFLALSVHAEVHSTTAVVMAATNLTACLSSIKYSHRVASNCKIGSNTAPNWRPSQRLDISYYRNQSLGTGAHSRKSCRFQFYIVISAAGEENFTTIAGADCTNPDLF